MRQLTKSTPVTRTARPRQAARRMAEATRQVAHHPAADAVPAGLLSHSLRVCPDDQLCGHRGTRAAVHRHSIHQSRLAHPPDAESRQFPVPVHRRSVWAFIRLFAKNRLFLHRHMSGVGLSHGLCDRANLEEHPKRAAARDHFAVLDLVPAAGVCARGNHSGDRLAQFGAAVARHHPSSAADHAHHRCGLSRHHLFVPAVHGAAAVRDAREAGLFAARGGGGPGQPAVARPSSTSRCRCRCPGSSPDRCWCSFPPSASS